MRTLHLIIFSIAVLCSAEAYSQESPALIKSLEIKFLYGEQYDYFLNKNPRLERGIYIDQDGKRYLTFSGLNTVFELIKDSQLENMIDQKQGNSSVIFISTFDKSLLERSAPYKIKYDQKGNYSIQD